MGFKDWLDQCESYDWQRYKKRRPGAITGAAKAARRGGGIAAPVNPTNLSKTPNSSAAGKVFKGMTIAGPDYKSIAKIHKPIETKSNYLSNPFKS